jgi:hypothetical protein
LEVSNQRHPDCFTFGKRRPIIHQAEDWVGTKTRINAMQCRKKNLLHLVAIKPQLIILLDHSLVTLPTELS